jgi:hypothetical protein
MFREVEYSTDCVIEVDRDISIIALKLKIEEETQIPRNQPVLTFSMEDRNNLDNSVTLDKYQEILEKKKILIVSISL